MQFVDDLDWQDVERNWKEEKIADKGQILIKHEDDIQNINQKISKDLTARFDVLEPKRSAAHPVIVPINHDFNNDIYFIGKQ